MLWSTRVQPTGFPLYRVFSLHTLKQAISANTVGRSVTRTRRQGYGYRAKTQSLNQKVGLDPAQKWRYAILESGRPGKVTSFAS